MNREEILKLKLDGSVLGDRKRLWDAELEMLAYFVDVCKKHDVTVYLAYGTLLGAIRHKGFIPWDEDIDVVVTREDFNKICDFADEEFKAPYSWQYALNDRNYFFRYGRLRREDMLGLVTTMSKYEYNCGLFIDVFILDEAPAKLSKRKKLWKKMKYYEMVMQNYYHPYKAHRSAKLTSPFFRMMGKFTNYDKLYKKYINIITKPAKDNTGLYVIWDMPNSAYKVIKKDLFFPPVEVEFMGHKFSAPHGYDEILTNEYGDYMTPPSESERLKWHDGICIFSADVSYKDFKKAFPEGFKKELFEKK